MKTYKIEKEMSKHDSRIPLIKLKFMCKFFLILFVLGFFLQSAYAQTTCFIKYTYDGAGNRIYREYVCQTDNTADEPETTNTGGGGTSTSGGSSAMKVITQDTIQSNSYSLVYPNPNSGEFWVEYKNDDPEQVINRKIYVLDLVGKIILELSTSNSKNKIELKNVSSGNYFVIINDGQKTESHKITIVK